jgi:two-component sensor histidine kinase
MEAKSAEELDFLQGGGEMGALIRSKDWDQTPLGNPETWPPGLRTAVRLMLTTKHPIFIFWGRELVCLYNDAYSQSIGPDRHPRILGEPGRQVWEEVWDVAAPQIETVMTGKGATWNVDHLVPITRGNQREDVYWTYSYSPIDDPMAPNGIGGALVICTETTKRVLLEQRLAEELEAKEILLREVNHRIKNSLQIVETLLNLEARSAQSEEARGSLNRASMRVHAIGSVHELVFRSDEIQSVQLQDYVRELCEAISFSIDSGARITLDCHSDDVTLSTDTAISIALLINELVTNAYKHAFPADRGGRIKVEVTCQDHSLQICVADDGVGKATDTPDNIGSKIIRGLAQQLNAELSEGNQTSGHTVKIQIPNNW